MTLAQVRKLALALPETSEQPHFEYTSFRVKGKIFATAPPEETHLHIFVDDEQRELALGLAPEFLENLPWGKKIVGLRVSLAKAKPALVEALLHQAWTRKAPQKLAALHGGNPTPLGD